MFQELIAAWYSDSSNAVFTILHWSGAQICSPGLCLFYPEEQGPSCLKTDQHTESAKNRQTPLDPAQDSKHSLCSEHPQACHSLGFKQPARPPKHQGHYRNHFTNITNLHLILLEYEVLRWLAVYNIFVSRKAYKANWAFSACTGIETHSWEILQEVRSWNQQQAEVDKKTFPSLGFTKPLHSCHWKLLCHSRVLCTEEKFLLGVQRAKSPHHLVFFNAHTLSKGSSWFNQVSLKRISEPALLWMTHL